MNANSKKDRVITLLISFNRLISKILRLKINDKQALGLLAEALQINKQILSLTKDNKISLEFVKQTFSLISIFAKEIVSKWLRYYLTPFLAIKNITKQLKNTMLTIGQLIKFGRMGQKISQDDLAKKLDVSKNYISLIENDKKDPSINFLKNTAKLLNIPLVLLIWERIDLPEGKTEGEKEIRKQIDKMVDKAHNLFAEQTFKLKTKK